MLFVVLKLLFREFLIIDFRTPLIIQNFLVFQSQISLAGVDILFVGPKRMQKGPFERPKPCALTARLSSGPLE